MSHYYSWGRAIRHVLSPLSSYFHCMQQKSLRLLPCCVGHPHACVWSGGLNFRIPFPLFLMCLSVSKSWKNKHLSPLLSQLEFSAGLRRLIRTHLHVIWKRGGSCWQMPCWGIEFCDGFLIRGCQLPSSAGRCLVTKPRFLPGSVLLCDSPSFLKTQLMIQFSNNSESHLISCTNSRCWS